MGCIGSHLAQFTSNSGHIHRSRQNVFSVLNVDEMGRNLQTGKLEVTETDLVLYVRGKSALTWPLRCLRRYGYDEDLFSFESGRRCPSGPGIYAFKCHRAQSLFNLLQAKIQGNPTALPPVPITPTPLNSASLSPTFDYVNISDQNNRGTIITTTMTTTTTNTTSLTAAATTTTHDQDGNDNTSTSQITQISQDNNHPLYMNVENHNPTSNLPHHHRQSNSSQKNGPTSSTSRLRNYSCNGTFFTDYPCGAVSNTSNSVYYSNVDCSLMQTTTTSSNAINNEVNNMSAAAEVNYAELDLETDSKITTMNSTTIAFNSMNHTKVSRLSTLGGSFGDDRFRAKVKPQIDPLTTTTTHDDDDDSIFTSVDPSTAVLNTNNIISSSAGAAVSSNNNNGGGPAAGYATIDFNRTAALSEIRNQLVNNRSNCNP